MEARPSSEPIEERLDAVHARLQKHASGSVPDRLTDPDPETPEERWDAGQVWAHMAEFVPYWLVQLGNVVRDYAGQPVPFGRTKADAARLEGIATGRNEPVSELMARVHDGVEKWTRYLSTLPPDGWQAIGLHGRRGEMDVRAIVETFLLDHLDEHAAQLDGLR
jgi:hypothetical protein